MRRRASIRRRNELRRSLPLLLMLGVAAFVPACDEQLPPRSDPKVLFTGSVTPQYILFFNENDVRLTVNVANVFDETLQDTASLEGQLEIVLLRDPTIVRTIQLSPDSLLTTSMYDPSTHMLTINPGDTLRMRAEWDLFDDRRDSLPGTVFKYYRDTACGLRDLALGESFLVRGSLSVFKRNGFVTIPPTGFNLCYVTHWTTIRECPFVVTPCVHYPKP
jgi:hypothetical protein